jgi:hypothetical protein
MVGMACVSPAIIANVLCALVKQKERFATIKQGSYLPTRIVESSPISPKTLRSHKTTTMITTAFKIDLMEPAIGMYELMSQRITPTTTKTTTT